jgi:hypothetical protein
MCRDVSCRVGRVSLRVIAGHRDPLRHACEFDRRQERANPDHSPEGTPATLKGNGARLSKGPDRDDPLADQLSAAGGS